MTHSMSRCCLVLWSLLICLVGAQDDSERFPLSGGIGTGVNVRVTAGIDQSMADMLKMDFEMPGGSVPFRWFPKLAESMIERSADLEGMHAHLQTWGKHTFDTGSMVTFDFLKTQYTWKTSIDGMRTPWFDFPVLTSNLITHLRIYSGFTNPLVTLSKPTCSTPCASSECKEGCMKDGSAVDASNCFSTFPQTMGSGNCSTMTTTNQDGGNCCDGMMESVDLSSLATGSWVMVRDDSAFVGRACESFSQSSSGCGSLAGRPVRVDNVDTAARTVLASAPPNKVQTFSYYALTPHTPIVKRVSVSQAQMNSIRNNGIDYNTRLVKMGIGDLVPQYWYVLAMHEKAGIADSEPWVPVIKDRWDFWCDNGNPAGIELLITDVGTELIDYINQCTDLTNTDGSRWEDRRNWPCDSHRNRGWCTEGGDETQQYFNDRNGQTFEDNIGDRDWYAPKACCGCGGGSLGGNLNTLPPPLTGMVTQMFIM